MKNFQKGFTLLEAMLAVSILAIVSMSIVYIQNYMSKQSVMIKEKAFATEKAIQIMEELRSLVAGSEKEQVDVLDNYDDGSTYNTVLTSNKLITDAGNPLSGNTNRGGVWKYLRRVQVQHIADDPYARKVYVDIYRNDPGNPGQPLETLAETIALLRTITGSLVPTQVLDVYVIEIENVPGWWSDLTTMRGVFDNVLNNIQQLNQGLSIREHLITRLAYGRDQEYYPYINETTNTNTTAMPYVYFYPGHMTDDSSNPYDYYLNSMIGAQMNVDGVRTNPGSYPLCDANNHAVRYPDELNLYNYYSSLPGASQEPSLRMLIEQMNSTPNNFRNILLVNLHGELLPMPPMRNYSDAAKAPAKFPFVRLVTHPEYLRYPNPSAASPINLRVYSYRTGNVGVLGQYYQWSTTTVPDKKTLANATLRLTRVDRKINFDWCGSGTPPNPNSPDPSIGLSTFTVCWTGYITPEYSEQYTFKTITDDGVELYINDPNKTSPVIDDWHDHPAAVNMYSMNLSANNTYYIEMHYYQNGGLACAKLDWFSAHQSTEPVPFDTIPLATVYSTDTVVDSSKITVQEIVGGPDVAYQKVNVDISVATSVCTVSYPSQGGTLITLYDSPLFSSYTTGGVAPFGGLRSSWTLYGLEYIPCPVGSDFSDDLTTSSNTKNTARWIISFAANSFATGMHTVETRIGSDLTTGTTFQYPNLSRTYFWVGQDPPVTEQYQYMGDPRHCPYLDVKLADRYNWYFTDINDTWSSYMGFGKTTNGWSGGNNNGGLCDMDIPRYFATYRNGLLATQSIWTAMNGWSYYYVGFGGEFGMDKSPFTNSLYFTNLPWSATGNNSAVNIDEIYNGTQRLIASTDKTWFAKNWIGELYSDDDYSSWQSTGNVPTGVGNYWRAKHKTDFPAFFNFNRSVNTNALGCSSFYNGSSGSGVFCHEGAPNGTLGTITSLGLDVSAIFNITLLTNISATRPFNLNNTGVGTPPEWNDATYSGVRTTISIPQVPPLPATGTSRVYYTSGFNSSTDNASAVVKTVLGSSTCYVSANGLDTQTNFGTIEMGEFIIMGMIRAFLDGGLYTGQDHIPQLPYVQITSPKLTDTFKTSSNITIAWTASWLRWDGQKYTSDYSAAYTESTTLVYNVKYYDGTNWRFCEDGTIAQDGVYDSNSPHSENGPSCTWSLSGLSSGASYILRVEAYRQGYLNKHYGYDEVQFRVSF